MAARKFLQPFYALTKQLYSVNSFLRTGCITDTAIFQSFGECRMW